MRWHGGIMVGAALLGVVAATAATAACTDEPTVATPVIEVDAPVTLADQPVRIQITGLAPGERVELSADAVDYQGAPWRSRATYDADEHGVVDLSRRAPVLGSYDVLDPMALLWSMDPVTGSVDQGGYFPPYPERQGSYEVTLTATGSTGASASQVLGRQWTTAGVTHRTLDLAIDGVAGDLYLPADGGAGSGVLLIGGSGGGPGPKFQAALLASRGHPALAVSYFAVPGRPETLRNIALEYFVTAARLLPGPVHVIGYSRGTEAALLLCALAPDVVRSAVVVAPADRVWPAYPPPGNAWTFGGLPQLDIPYDRIDKPLLAIAGTDDRLWPAGPATTTLAARLGAETYIHPGAGHGVTGLPYLPSGNRTVHPVTGDALDYGGSRRADAVGKARAWARVLDFLAAH